MDSLRVRFIHQRIITRRETILPAFFIDLNHTLPYTSRKTRNLTYEHRKSEKIRSNSLANR